MFFLAADVFNTAGVLMHFPTHPAIERAYIHIEKVLNMNIDWKTKSTVSSHSNQIMGKVFTRQRHPASIFLTADARAIHFHILYWIWAQTYTDGFERLRFPFCYALLLSTFTVVFRTSTMWGKRWRSKFICALSLDRLPNYQQITRKWAFESAWANIVYFSQKFNWGAA